MTWTPAMDDGGDRQKSVIEFLTGPTPYGLASGGVQVIETHISIVFIAGDRAYKLKRARRLPYLDFSTLERRREACEAELTLNRRTAPDMYLGLVPVVQQPDGRLGLGGEGTPVEWLVEMKRVDQSNMFDALAVAGRLDRHMMEQLADHIAAFHLIADVFQERGGATALQEIVTNNHRSFEVASGADPAKVDVLASKTTTLIGKLSNLLDTRRATGFIRHCHGDMHLRNIFLDEAGQPTLFDAIEFSDEFAVIDTLYDLAFLLMDLDHRGHRRLANIVLNRYIGQTGDTEGIAALPLFMSIRASIRGHVALAAANAVGDPTEKAKQRANADSYLDRAISYLDPQAVRLVAVGGLSGSGKSRLAREIAPYLGLAPGALVARSDVIRKRLAGVSPNDRLEDKYYGAEMTERTFKTLYGDAAAALNAGYSAVGDAVFAIEKQRLAMEHVAEVAGVPFQGIWLEAAPEIMAERIVGRTDNVSDATTEVLEMQMAYDLGNITWKRLSSAGTREETLQAALRYLGVEYKENL